MIGERIPGILQYRVDCAVKGERNWATNSLRFTDVAEALSYAVGLYGRWTMLWGWRVVPESVPDREPITDEERTALTDVGPDVTGLAHPIG